MPFDLLRDKIPLVRQTEATECGLACLVMVLRHHRYHASLTRLRALFPVAADTGMSMLELARCARQFGMAPRALQGHANQLKTVAKPAILHWRGNHFVVLVQATARRIRIHDPALGTLDYTVAEAEALFAGFVLELHRGPTFTRLPATAAGAALGVRELARVSPAAPRLQRASGAFAAIGLLLLFLAPAYVQWVVDDAIKQGDVDYLLLLGSLFALIFLFDTLARFLRGWTELALKARHQSAISCLLQTKLLDRPLAALSTSALGNALLLEKAGAAVAGFAASGFTDLLGSAVTLAIGLAFMAAYSLKLASLTLCSVVLLMAFRLALRTRYQSAFDRELSAQANLESVVMENDSGFQTIKSNALEWAAAQRLFRQQSNYLNRRYRRGLIALQLRSGSDAVMQLERVLVVGLGAGIVIQGEMTIGMLYAFIQYKMLFADACNRLLQRWLDHAALAAPVERIQALLEMPGESDPNASVGGDLRCVIPRRPMPAWHELRVTGLSYTPPGRHRPLIDKLDWRLAPHGARLIVGGSGSGKTTLLRLLGGLLLPTAGTLTLDGTPIDTFSHESVRRRIRVLHVDESFFHGSIATNICGLSEAVDHVLLNSVCRLACIDQVIDALPAGFDTLMDRTANLLSAGQRQRLSLARALYTRPDLLLCDEITANLDDETARRLIGNLCSLGIGLVFATHDPQLFADDMPRFALCGGKLETLRQALPT